MTGDKRHQARIGRHAIRLVALCGLVCLLGGRASLADGVIASTEWINLYSTNSTLDGQALPLGSSIAVFDSQGTQCGEFQVTREGWYGLMACYRDDARTVVDEGPVAGDVLRFTINGEPATATPVRLTRTRVAPSTEVVWTAHGDVWEVDLQGVSRSQVIGGYSLPVARATRFTVRAGLLIAAFGFAIAAVARHSKHHRDEPGRSPP